MSINKIDRNREVVRLVNSGYTFSKIAEVFKITRQTAHEIYHREKKKIKQRVRSSPQVSA